MKKLNSLPVHFEADSNVSTDSRFQKVKIWIAHTGENLNNSVFTKDTLSKMSSSLSNIPIVGRVKEVNGGEDFGSHEKEFLIKDDGIEVRMGTVAYGFLGDDNDAAFEVSEGKEWLTAKGYLWTRFADVKDIFSQSGGAKSQSMEVGGADGYVDERGRFVFTNGRFEALCILGDDISPAMTGSIISTQFSETKDLVSEMFKEFSKERGIATMATKPEDLKKKKKPEDEDPAKSTDDKNKKSADGANGGKDDPNSTDSKKSDDGSTTSTSKSSDEGDDKKTGSDTGADKGADKTKKTPFPLKDDDGASTTDGKKEDSKDKDKKKKSKKVAFELSDNDKRGQLVAALQDSKLFDSDENYIFVEDVFSNHAIVEVSPHHEGARKLYDVEFSISPLDQVVIGGATEVFAMYLTGKEKAEVEGSRQTIKDLTGQLEKAKEFQAQFEAKEKEGLLNQFASKLGSAGVQSIRENADFSAWDKEELRGKIALALLDDEPAGMRKPQINVFESFKNTKNTSWEDSLKEFI